jgi:hypothetical protein
VVCRGAAGLYLVSGNQARKMLKGSVPGFFGIIGKTTTGQLPALQVIAQTLAADSFARTRIICAITPIEVLFLIAFQLGLLCQMGGYFLE